MTTSFSSTKRTLLGTGLLLSGALLGMLAASGVWADGQQDTETVLSAEMTIPYHGFLMLDSRPLNGQYVIRFDLYDTSGGTGASVDMGGDMGTVDLGVSLWDSVRTVEVRNGRFSVALGEQNSLADIIERGDQLWLEVTILESTSGGGINPITISGRQAIDVTPYAAWAGKSIDFNVSGLMRVASGKDLTISGPTQVNGDVSISGPETDGTNAALRITSAGSSDTLMIDTNEILSNGTIHLQPSSKQRVEAYNGFQALEDSTLGSGYTNKTVIYGTDNTGSQAALEISSSNAETLYIDGNEIDSSTGLPLELNVHANSDVGFYGDLSLEKALLFSYSTWEGGDTGASGAAIANDDGIYDALMIVGNESDVDRRIELFDNVQIGDTLGVLNGATLRGGVTVDDDLTVSGTLTRTTNSCPGNESGSVYSSTSKSRLCVYNFYDTSGKNTDFNDASDACWTNYGAELCSYNQMRIALNKNAISVNSVQQSTTGSQGRWLRDRPSDNNGLVVDGSNEDDFDFPEVHFSHNDYGAFCCRIIQGR